MTENNDHRTEPSPRQRRAALSHLFQGGTVEEAADLAGVTEERVARWREEVLDKRIDHAPLSEAEIKTRFEYNLEEYRVVRSEVRGMYETAHRVLQWTAGGAIAGGIGALVAFEKPRTGFTGSIQLGLVALFFPLILMSLVTWTTEIYRAARSMVYMRSRERALWSAERATTLKVEEAAILDVTGYPLLLGNYMAYGPMALSRWERFENYALPGSLYGIIFTANSLLFAAVLINHRFDLLGLDDKILKGLCWSYLGLMWLALLVIVGRVLRRSYRMSRQIYGFRASPPEVGKASQRSSLEDQAGP